MFKRRGTTSMKFQFGCIIHSVEIACPLSVERKMSIKWVRGPHNCETDTVVNALHGDKKLSRFEWGPAKPLVMIATLYREKNGKFQSKRSKLSVKQYYDGKKTTVGKLVIDLGLCVREGQDFGQKYTSDLQKCPSKAKIVYSIYSRLVLPKPSPSGGPGHLSVLKEEELTKSQLESLVESEFDHSKYESRLEASEPPERSKVGGSVLKGGKKDLTKLVHHIRDSDLPQSRRQLLATYKYSFYASDLVDWLLKQEYVAATAEAVSVGQALLDSKLIRLANTDADDKTWAFGNDSTLLQLASMPDDKGGVQDVEELNVSDILETPQYAVELRRFLEKNLCLESFLFLEAAHAFEHSTSADQVQRARAAEIFKTYILDTGEYAVNVDSTTREEIERTLAESPESTSIPSDLFAAAVRMIVNMLQRDVFKRFVIDPAYEKMIATNTLNATVIAAEGRHRASYRAIPLEDDFFWMDQLVEKMQREKDLIADRRVKLKKFPKCFSGSALVDYLLYQQQAKVRPGAVALAQRMLDASVIRSAVDKAETEFMDEPNAYFEIGTPLPLPEGITAESSLEKLDCKFFYSGKLLVKGVRYTVAIGVVSPRHQLLHLFRPSGSGMPFLLPGAPANSTPSANQPYLIVSLSLKGAQLKQLGQKEKDDSLERVVSIKYLHLFLAEPHNADTRRLFVFRFDDHALADEWATVLQRVIDHKPTLGEKSTNCNANLGVSGPRAGPPAGPPAAAAAAAAVADTHAHSHVSHTSVDDVSDKKPPQSQAPPSGMNIFITKPQ